jgi:hypothetical protein
MGGRVLHRRAVLARDHPISIGGDVARALLLTRALAEPSARYSINDAGITVIRALITDGNYGGRPPWPA